MADEALSVKISAPGATETATQIAQLSSGFEHANTSAETLAKVLREIETDLQKTRGETTTHTTALKEHGDVVEGVASHYRMMSAGLGALGLDAEAAAVKVDALTQVVRGMAAAAPELLAIGAAIAVGAASFSFLKDSVDEAARSERELVTIGALLKNQSVADWQAQAKAVDEYASTIARTSVFQKTDALAGMQAMLTAGVSYNDTIRSQAAAMDLAVSKTITLAQADQELADAYDGRFRGLVKLGIITKEEQKNGIEYEAILQRIEGRMSGSAAAALETYSGKVQNLQNLTSLLKEEFGTALLPVLGAFEDEMRQGVDAMQPLADEFKAWAQQHLPELKTGAQGFADLMLGIGEHALPLVEKATQSAMKALADLGATFGTDKDPVDAFAEGIHGVTGRIGELLAARQQLHDELAPLVDGFNALSHALDDADSYFDNLLTHVDASQQPFTSWSGWVASVRGEFDLLAGAIDRVSSAFRAIENFGTWVSGALDRVQGIDDAAKQRARDQFRQAHGGGAVTPTATHVFGYGDALPEPTVDPLGAGPTQSRLAAAMSSGPTIAAAHALGLALSVKPDAPLTHASTRHIEGTSSPRGKGTPGSSTSFSYTPIDPEASTKTDEYTTAQKNLEAALKRVDDGEKSLAESIKTATTVEGQHAAQAAYDAQVAVDLFAKKQMLVEATRTEKSEIADLTAKQNDARSEEERYRQAHKALGDELVAQANSGHAATIQQQNDLAELKAQHDAAKKAADGFASSIKTLDGNLRTNTTALADVNNKLGEFKSKAEEAFASASRAWGDYQKKTAASLAEDLATANLSNTEKVAYYGDSLAKMAALDAQYRDQFKAAKAAVSAALDAEQQHDSVDNRKRVADAMAAENDIGALFDANVKSMEAADGKYSSAFKAAIADRENAYKAFIASVQGYETSFLDDVLKKHVSLKDSVKNVLAQMMTDWVTHLEQMIVKSAILDKLNSPDGAFGKLLIQAGILQKPGGSTGNPALDAAIDARITGEHTLAQSTTTLIGSQGQNTQSLTTATGALGSFTAAVQRAASAVGSGGGASGFDSIFGAFNPATGSGVNIDPAAIAAAAPAALDPLAGFNAGAFGTPVNITSIADLPLAGGHGVPVDVKQIGGFSAAGALQGLMIGNLIAGLDGGNSTWGGVGGAVGGYLGGPVGSAIGGFIGSQIGPHWGPPSNYPDRSDPSYTPWLNAFNSGPGGVGDKTEQLLKGTSASSLTGQALKDYQQLMALEGGTGQLGIKDEHNGIFTLFAGTTDSVTDFRALVDRFNQEMSGANATLTSTVFTLTRTYPDPNIGRLNASGTYTASPVTVGTTTTGNGNNGNGGGGTDYPYKNQGLGTGGSGGDLVVNFQLDGKTVATSVVPRVATLMNRQALNLSPGGSNNWGGRRTGA